MNHPHPYGHFNESGDEFIVTNPATPRAFDNMLWNAAIFSNVQQTGVGYCDYQIDGTEGVQLMTGVGRICDFDVFGCDHLMSRLVYIRDNETGRFGIQVGSRYARNLQVIRADMDWGTQLLSPLRMR